MCTSRASQQTRSSLSPDIFFIAFGCGAVCLGPLKSFAFWGEEGMTAPGEEQERLGVPLSHRGKPTVPSESVEWRSSVFLPSDSPSGAVRGRREVRGCP